MIRQIVKLGTWLDKRFPEKVVVTKADYESIENDISDMAGLLTARIEKLEASAVHVDAVKEVIKHVEQVKQEVQALKFNLGLNNVTGSKDVEIQAVLNGESI